MQGSSERAFNACHAFALLLSRTDKARRFLARKKSLALPAGAVAPAGKQREERPCREKPDNRVVSPNGRPERRRREIKVEKQGTAERHRSIRYGLEESGRIKIEEEKEEKRTMLQSFSASQAIQSGKPPLNPLRYAETVGARTLANRFFAERACSMLCYLVDRPLLIVSPYQRKERSDGPTPYASYQLLQRPRYCDPEQRCAIDPARSDTSC